MNTSTTRHPFALPAFVLSILITSTMALIPAAAAIGANSHNGQAIQTATVQSQYVEVAG
jgi:hypothetical protein